MRDLPDLIDAVQRNCDIADARHAGEATLCTYLLRMREHFRWENELPLAAQPRKEELSAWLTEREARWDALAGEDFGPVPVGERDHDPFDAESLNGELLGRGLVYGAGYARFHRPSFFLAEIDRSETREGLRVLVAGCELARDLEPAPAALRGDTIFVRRDALRRWLWERVEFWQSRRGEGALARAVHAWGLDGNDEAAFERAVNAETETVILHELGEARAGRLLGPQWEAMLAGCEDRRAELVARAVRDNLADCLVTLPALVAREAHASIHFYFSHFDGLRRELFPALAAAYRQWHETASADALAEAAASGAAHWERVARGMLSASPCLEPSALALLGP
ncbi:MAG: hypothetical protein N2544_17240 [Burkholderiales bacterium]|nr:hypothetical protein [Burkholderiales bacterium]